MAYYSRYQSKFSKGRDTDRLTSRYDIPKDLSSKRKGYLDDSSVGKSLDTLRPITKYSEKKIDSVLGYLGGPLNPRQLLLNDMSQAGSSHRSSGIFNSSSEFKQSSGSQWKRDDQPTWGGGKSSSPFRTDTQKTPSFKSQTSESPFKRGETTSSFYKKQDASPFSTFKSQSDKQEIALNFRPSSPWSTYNKPQSSNLFKSKTTLFESKPQPTGAWHTGGQKTDSKSIFKSGTSSPYKESSNVFSTKSAIQPRDLHKRSTFGEPTATRPSQPASLSWKKLTGVSDTKAYKNKQAERRLELEREKEQKEMMEAAVRRQVARMDETYLQKKQRRAEIPQTFQIQDRSQIWKWKGTNPSYSGVKYVPKQEGGLRWNHPLKRRTYSPSKNKLIEEMKKPYKRPDQPLYTDQHKRLPFSSEFAKDPNIIDLVVEVETHVPGVVEELKIKANKEAKIGFIKDALLNKLYDIGLGPETGWDSLNLFKNGTYLSDYHTVSQMGLDKPGAVLKVKLINSKQIEREVARLPYEEESKVIPRDSSPAECKRQLSLGTSKGKYDPWARNSFDSLEQNKSQESPRFYDANGSFDFQEDQRPKFDERLIFEPSIAQLKKMSLAELQEVRGLVITHPDFGQIRYRVPVDITDVDFRRDVMFQRGEIDVYPEKKVKPPKGYKLNQPAEFDLYCPGLPRNHTKASYEKDCKERCRNSGVSEDSNQVDFLNINDRDLTVHVRCEEW